jgi:hypothetical protein
MEDTIDEVFIILQASRLIYTQLIVAKLMQQFL